ncbi:MAG TPA: lactonase family protein [Acidobacteriota bacterium]|nr:lactonase family protein [Acidobacteriota bacterium]
MSRRQLLGGAVLTWAAARGQTTQPAGQQPETKSVAVYAYVGCYTTAKRYARGDGIHVYHMSPETGDWTPVQQLGNLTNPSFLVLSPSRLSLYSVHGDETYVTAFAVDRNSGRLAMLNRIETGGRNGVHPAVDPSGRFLLVANYNTGNVSVLSLRQDGSLGERVQLVALQGQPGPHRTDQTSSHPHQIVFDPSGKFVMVPDKGLDRVFMFLFDAATGNLTPTVQGSAAARSGSGPRHAAFHPSLPVAWVLNEISSTVTTYYMEAERGSLRAAQILPSLPPDYTGENTGAEIAASSDGRYVYCSNRGHDSIAIFSADPATGLLTPAGWTPTQGRIPRFIGFDPSRRFLYAANEQSDTVVTFLADADSGRLTPTGQVVRTASPVAIAFARY